MVHELWQALAQNVLMGLWFLLPLICCRLADIAFGVVIAHKTEKITFDIKKTLRSLIYCLVLVGGLLLLISGVTMLPVMLDYYQIGNVDTEALNDIISIAMVIAILVGSTVTYGKDAFSKLKSILGKGVEEAELLEEVIDIIPNSNPSTDSNPIIVTYDGDVALLNDKGTGE